ncbi:hypothetical protein [Leekyejoonella antrihumi]|uniref:Uncharacterized protein n=1 Tax=Leekyejoonella antrihumi TaxID=1660198 RepID=A0A563DUW2_9MICO|nr:hypothetical protein [Leekyejoonella antrihumi]TWP33723.1 hypothetical protein FGL98_19990 [Leekyejoonella antrihumi]
MRGRPRDLPFDETPLRGGRVDTRARVAWLLRVSRMASADGGTGADFCRRLSEHGYPVGASVLSRRESGQEETPGAMISAYERALGLPSGHMRGVCEAMWRSLEVGAPRSSAVPMSRLELADELARIDELVDAGGMQGGDWLSLAHVLGQPAGLILPPSVQERWTYRLLTEMVCSVQGAYISRVEALSRMMVEPLTRDTVRAAVRTFIAEPGAQGVIDAVAILGETSDPDVVTELLSMFVQQRGAVRQGAATALLQSIVLGQLSAAQVVQLRTAILTVVRDDPQDGAAPAFMMAQRLSLQMTREVVEILGFNPGDKPAGAHIQSPAALREYVAAAEAVSGIHGDRMLERLLREALSDDFVERQHHALMTLVVSPYRNALAETAIQLVDGSPDPVAREAAGHMLSYLAGEPQVDHLCKLLERPDPQLQLVGLMGLAHSIGVPADVDLHDQLTNLELSSRAVYAAGMSRHPDIRPESGIRIATTQAQAQASWWLQHGSGIREFGVADGLLPRAHSIAS